MLLVRPWIHLEVIAFVPLLPSRPEHSCRTGSLKWNHDSSLDISRRCLRRCLRGCFWRCLQLAGSWKQHWNDAKATGGRLIHLCRRWIHLCSLNLPGTETIVPTIYNDWTPIVPHVVFRPRSLLWHLKTEPSNAGWRITFDCRTVAESHNCWIFAATLLNLAIFSSAALAI